jgi:NAD(P)H dehydrogenase (quinone)
MGKVLILYHSQTGNTKEMAGLVAAGAKKVPGMEIKCLSIKEAKPDDLLWCDGIALGAPTHMGVAPWQVVQWWTKAVGKTWRHIDGKIGCAFSSAGGWGGGSEMTVQSLLKILMNFGVLVFGATDYTGKHTTLHYGTVAAGKPKTAREKEACRRLGRRLAEWVAVLHEGRKEQSPHQAKYKRFKHN